MNGYYFDDFLTPELLSSLNPQLLSLDSPEGIRTTLDREQDIGKDESSLYYPSKQTTLAPWYFEHLPKIRLQL